MNDPRTMTLNPYIPSISEEELDRRNRAAILLLDSWETEGDEAEQRETMAILRQTLGQGRIASDRSQFP